MGPSFIASYRGLIQQTIPRKIVEGFGITRCQIVCKALRTPTSSDVEDQVRAAVRKATLRKHLTWRKPELEKVLLPTMPNFLGKKQY